LLRFCEKPPLFYIYGSSQDSFELVFGAQNRSNDEDGTVTMTSKNAVYHKGYKESTLKNDIAIITLPKPISETSIEKVTYFLQLVLKFVSKIEFIRMIRLPKRIQANRFMKKGTTVNVAGWGRTTDGKLLILMHLR
jgi:hypothetical protein